MDTNANDGNMDVSDKNHSFYWARREIEVLQKQVTFASFLGLQKVHPGRITRFRPHGKRIAAPMNITPISRTIQTEKQTNLSNSRISIKTQWTK